MKARVSCVVKPLLTLILPLTFLEFVLMDCCHCVWLTGQWRGRRSRWRWLPKWRLWLGAAGRPSGWFWTIVQVAARHAIAVPTSNTQANTPAPETPLTFVLWWWEPPSLTKGNQSHKNFWNYLVITMTETLWKYSSSGFFTLKFKFQTDPQCFAPSLLEFLLVASFSATVKSCSSTPPLPDLLLPSSAFLLSPLIPQHACGRQPH